MKITKYILILTFAFITPIMTNAKVNVDIQAAPQLSNKMSFRAGVNVEVPLSDNLSLDPELYYSMRHRQREESLKTTSQSGEILEVNSCELNAIANYLQLPIYLSYNIPTRETDMQKVMFGPYFAYCMGGNSTITQRHDDTEIFSLTSPTYPTFLDSRFVDNGDRILCLHSEARYDCLVNDVDNGDRILCLHSEARYDCLVNACQTR